MHLFIRKLVLFNQFLIRIARNWALRLLHIGVFAFCQIKKSVVKLLERHNLHRNYENRLFGKVIFILCYLLKSTNPGFANRVEKAFDTNSSSATNRDKLVRLDTRILANKQCESANAKSMQTNKLGHNCEIQANPGKLAYNYTTHLQYCSAFFR